MPFALVPDAAFWDAFWPDFWSDLAVGILITLLLAAAYSKLRRLRLTSRINIKDQGNQIQFGLAAENTGRVSFRRDEVIWHVFLEEGLDITHGDPGELGWAQVSHGRAYAHYKGALDSPVFVDTAKGFLDLTIAVPDEPREIRAYLSTAYGRFPRGATDESSQDGDQPLETMPVVLRIGGGRVEWIETAADRFFGFYHRTIKRSDVIVVSAAQGVEP